MQTAQAAKLVRDSVSRLPYDFSTNVLRIRAYIKKWAKKSYETRSVLVANSYMSSYQRCTAIVTMALVYIRGSVAFQI